MAKRTPMIAKKLTPEEVSGIEKRLFETLLPLMPESLFLVGVSLIKEPGVWYLQVFIDNAERSISLQNCESVTKAIDPALDALSERKDFPEFSDLSYLLEVSSPGLFRKLQTEREFQFYLGQRIEVAQEDTAPIIGLLKHYNLSSQTLELLKEGEQSESTLQLTPNHTVTLCPVIQIPED